VIIDPIVAFLDRSVTSYCDASVRGALNPLAQLAEKHRAVILLVRHLNKDNGPHALYRGGGSIGFIAACRLGWLVGRDPRMEERLVLAQTKNNYAPRQPSLAYQLPKDAPRIDWQGPSAWSADDLTLRRECPARRRARDFLRLFLEHGPRPAREIWQASRELGLSEATLKRARKELKIGKQRIHENGKRNDYWLLEGQQLPQDGKSDFPDLDDWLRRWREMYPPRTPLENDVAD
jgi:RecA-family ATPase